MEDIKLPRPIAITIISVLIFFLGYITFRAAYTEKKPSFIDFIRKQPPKSIGKSIKSISIYNDGSIHGQDYSVTLDDKSVINEFVEILLGDSKSIHPSPNHPVAIHRGLLRIRWVDKSFFILDFEIKSEMSFGSFVNYYSFPKNISKIDLIYCKNYENKKMVKFLGQHIPQFAKQKDF